MQNLTVIARLVISDDRRQNKQINIFLSSFLKHHFAENKIKSNQNKTTFIFSVAGYRLRHCNRRIRRENTAFRKVIKVKRNKVFAIPVIPVIAIAVNINCRKYPKFKTA